MAASSSRRNIRSIVRLLATTSEVPNSVTMLRRTTHSRERFLSAEIRATPNAANEEDEVQTELQGVAGSDIDAAEFAAMHQESTFESKQFDGRAHRKTHPDYSYTKNWSERGLFKAAPGDMPSLKSGEDVANLKIDCFPNFFRTNPLPGPLVSAESTWSPSFIEYSRARAKFTAKICSVRNFHALTSKIDASRDSGPNVSIPLRPEELVEHHFLLHDSIQSCTFSSDTRRVRDDSQGRDTTFERLESKSAHRGTESVYKSWIQRVLPEKLWPYAQLARLDRPIGSWLLAWPCVWSICLAAPSGSLPDPVLLGLFVTGAFLLRGAGCTINDLWDRDIDKMVERTRNRPLASGALTCLQGILFLACQLLAGLGILLQLNSYSQALGVTSLLLVGTYPLMKRVTFWPQAYLGLTLNWGALMGWAAVQGGLQLSTVLPLYAAGICWTLVYDTIYAHQDKEDDLKVGVKSTALLFGTQTKTWLTGFGAACIANLALAGWTCNLGWPFYLGLVGAAGHLGWQVLSVDIHNGSDCSSKFVSNKWFGAIVSAGVILGKIAVVPA